MAEEFKIANAFIEFTTKGDTKPEIRQQAQAADRLTQQSRSLATLQHQNDAEKMRSLAEMGRAADRLYEKEKDRKAAERLADKIAAQERTARQVHLANQSMAWQTGLGAAGHALGGLPFVQTATQLGQAMVAARQVATSNAIEQGKSKEAAAAAGRAAMLRAGAIGAGVAAVSYGIEGAKKASPQAAENLNYQMDRLQAIIGRSFVPALQAAATALEKIGTLVGGKGAQLNMPQFSDFAQMRDRLQIAALAGMHGAGGVVAGLIGGNFGGNAGKGAGGGETFTQRTVNSFGGGWLVPGYAVWRMAGGRSISSLWE